VNHTFPFQRARKPEEQQLRRETILAAAAELFDAEGPQGAGLNAIAARAGFTKSNVYRYFESREEVLLSLFLAELEGLVPDLEQRFERCPDGDIEALAKATADVFIIRPRFCQLLSMLSSVLEQNVSETAIVTLKRGVAVLNARLAVTLQRKLAGTSVEDCSWVAAMSATFVAGLWPSAHASPTALKVMAMPEFAHLKPVAERDLARAIGALMASIVPPTSRA
jgi:TetR/AcrR family transcriptional regulator